MPDCMDFMFGISWYVVLQDDPGAFLCRSLPGSTGCYSGSEKALSDQVRPDIEHLLTFRL